MNKAFVREPDATAAACPRCGAEGHSTPAAALARYLPEAARERFPQGAFFCPTPKCEIAYFDALGGSIPADDLARPAHPKDPSAPICACFGFSIDEIEADVREGTVARTRAQVARAKSAAANCGELAPDGRSCVARVQKYYLERSARRDA